MFLNSPSYSATAHNSTAHLFISTNYSYLIVDRAVKSLVRRNEKRLVKPNPPGLGVASPGMTDINVALTPTVTAVPDWSGLESKARLTVVPAGIPEAFEITQNTLVLPVTEGSLQSFGGLGRLTKPPVSVIPGVTIATLTPTLAALFNAFFMYQALEISAIPKKRMKRSMITSAVSMTVWPLCEIFIIFIFG
jgi:hypothetical protein